MLKFLVIFSFLLPMMNSCLNNSPNGARKIQNIRLAGLGGVYYGRVEVQMNGKWSTICDDGWDDDDAKVVCRALGMKGGIAYGRSWFAPGTGEITMTEVDCKGDEFSLNFCKYNNCENFCSHREDAGVMCEKLT